MGHGGEVGGNSFDGHRTGRKGEKGVVEQDDQAEGNGAEDQS